MIFGWVIELCVLALVCVYLAYPQIGYSSLRSHVLHVACILAKNVSSKAKMIYILLGRLSVLPLLSQRNQQAILELGSVSCYLQILGLSSVLSRGSILRSHIIFLTI
jgi:hypothetical protein